MCRKTIYMSFVALMVRFSVYICTCVRMCLADLIEMAGKKKVVPIEIEEYIKNEVEFLSNVVLIGHQRKYLTCLLTLKVRICLTSERLVVLLLYM